VLCEFVGHVPPCPAVIQVDRRDDADVTERRFMSTDILVTGGTGTLGRLLVPRLRDAGHSVRVMSRHGDVRGDLATGAGVEAALAGAEIVVHCAGSAKGDGLKARTLVAALPETVRHLVFISVVGADRVPIESGIDRAMFGYYGAKHEAERAIAGSGVPWTTLRATQFHDLMLSTVRALTKLPVVPVPGVRFQPVDSAEVADRLAELAVGAPAGLVPDLAGPRVYALRELVRGYLDARRKHRAILPVRAPGKAARAMREGANLSPDRAVGRRTWEDFLAASL
jgi:uncharacterized protein YbjT (DUF2867 family)